jgi:hypothetical protein
VVGIDNFMGTDSKLLTLQYRAMNCNPKFMVQMHMSSGHLNILIVKEKLKQLLWI